MDGQIVYPDAAQRAMTILKAKCGSVFKEFYLGLPDNFMPPQSAFPLVIVDTIDEEGAVGPTTGDDITEVFYIRIMVDIKTGFGAPDNVNSVKRQLQLFTAGRDPSTGYLLPTSILGIMRSNLTLNSPSVPGLVTINAKYHISYQEGHYKNLPETREAIVEITVTERQMVLNRNQG